MVSFLTLAIPATKKFTIELYKTFLKPISLKLHPRPDTTEEEKTIKWKAFFSNLIRLLIILAVLFIIWKLIIKIFPALAKKSKNKM